MLHLLVDQSHRTWFYPPLENKLAGIRWTKIEEITLDQFVPYNELHIEKKMILCLVLARSFLGLLETNWLPSHSQWGLSNISIFD